MDGRPRSVRPLRLSLTDERERNKWAKAQLKGRREEATCLDVVASLMAKGPLKKRAMSIFTRHT